MLRRPALQVYFMDTGLIQLLRYPALVALPQWPRTRSVEELHEQLSVAKKQGAYCCSHTPPASSLKIASTVLRGISYL